MHPPSQLHISHLDRFDDSAAAVIAAIQALSALSSAAVPDDLITCAAPIVPLGDI